ncbi:MAG: insulinase family protein [Anaerolineales bacterium]|nr:insulinase family protein [Anaerolineales bacterium]
MSAGRVRRAKLRNGLLVLLKEIHAAPLISLWAWYRVGSRNERAGQTGISHWVEHMQFKGSAAFPAGSLDRAVSREGGVWNAMTWLDWTAYYETLPADRIDLGLRLEADRMTGSIFAPKEVASERTVIISERQGHENEPTFRLSEEVQAAAFRVHSYHHEVVGDVADLSSMTRDDLYGHYRDFYVPNNALLAVAGDFQSRAMLDRIRRLFGGISAGPAPNRGTRPEPAQRGERRVTVEGPGETAYVEAAYHAPAATDPDFFPMVVLDSVLAGPSNFNMFTGGISNKTSRLYRALVETELAAGVSGSLAATIDPYLYSITATVRNGKTPDQVLAALDAELKRAAEESLRREEMERAMKQARAIFAYGSETVTNQAFWMGYAEMFSSIDWFDNYLSSLAAVTADDVRRVAHKVLAKRNRTVGFYLPSGADGGSGPHPGG